MIVVVVAMLAAVAVDGGGRHLAVVGVAVAAVVGIA